MILIQDKLDKLEQFRTSASQWEVMELGDLLAMLGVGVIFSLAVQWHFQIFGSTFSNRREFARNFPLITLTTILVIAVVKSSITLGIGMVGALSIVRFRTPIKEPEELAYLFLSIGIGLGLGAGLPYHTTMSATTILLVMAILQWRRRERHGKSLFLSIEWSDTSGHDRPLDRITATVGEHAIDNDLRRVDSRGKQLDATFFVDLASIGDLSDLLVHLKKDCPGANITVIDQNRMPSV